MKKIILIVFKLVLVIFILFFFIHITLYFYIKTIPKIDLKNINNIQLYDKEGNLFFQGNGKEEWISLKKMSPNIIKATISIEDKNFFNHFGFDYLRILKSFYRNLNAGKIIEGASTITQQYAKNLYLDFNKTWKRKLIEYWITLQIEVHYSKEEILEGYLNTINYGNGIFGIENASKYYFNKSSSELTLAEATMLAGIPRSPNNYSPLYDEKMAKKRQYKVLTSMVKNKYISEKQKEENFQKELVFFGKKEKYDLKTLMYYQKTVIDELKQIKTIPESLIETGGLKIYTNLDINAQTILEKTMKNNLKDYKDMQIAMVVIEPKTGKIIALTGGQDYTLSQFNRATDSKRQVGSTMKPFLYYAALENGFTPSTTFLSEPTVFTFNNNETYAPKNFAELYPHKPISMIAALAYSDNIYAIKTHLFLGKEVLVDTIKRVGIKEKINPHPSLPLGTEEINIIDFLTGYNTLANLGVKMDLKTINRIEDINNNVLYKNKKEGITVINKNISFILNELLTTSYDYSMIDYSYPTCINIADRLSKKYALKSGSTDFDSWAIGYNKKILVGVWNGYDKNKKITSNEVKLSRFIWADFIEEFLKEQTNEWYNIPENIVGTLVDPLSGEPITNEKQRKKIIYYIKGTEPNKK
ncbi:MAG: transglycosylase domain-containing protein [Bacilli bacterium]